MTQINQLMDAVLSADPVGIAVLAFLVGFTAWLHYLYVYAVARRVFWRQARQLGFAQVVRDRRGRFKSKRRRS